MCVCTVLGFTACSGEKTSEHTHDYGSTWSYDEAGHWQVCSCDAKSEVVAHTPGTEATSTAPQVCTVCGYVITEALGNVITYTNEINYKFATAEEKLVIDKAIARIEAISVEKGYKIPKMDENSIY